jgi:hypothetical protein
LPEWQRHAVLAASIYRAINIVDDVEELPRLLKL